MKQFFLLIFLGFFSVNLSFGQSKEFCATIDNLLSFSVDTIMPQTLVNKNLKEFIILDTRQEKEYLTSHLTNAQFVDYDRFDIADFRKKNPNTYKPVIVYCTVGYRSEKIGEKLKKAGYRFVYNLYGGIVEWKNQENRILNQQNKTTEEVHTYSKEWSKWLLKGIKIYD